jgi:hypothetical protein
MRNAKILIESTSIYWAQHQQFQDTQKTFKEGFTTIASNHREQERFT